MGAFVPAAVGVAAGGLSAWGQVQGGKAASRAAQYNAQVAEMTGREESIASQFNAAVARANAEAIRTSADIEMGRLRKAKAAIRGTQVARYAKAGVKLEGSPLSVLIDSAAEAELDIAITDFNAKTATSQAEYSAKQFERQGRAAVLLASGRAAQERLAGAYYKQQGYTGAASKMFETTTNYYAANKDIFKRK